MIKIENVKKITIIGAGNLGSKIAQVSLLAGFEKVVLNDIKMEIIENAANLIENGPDTIQEKNKGIFYGLRDLEALGKLEEGITTEMLMDRLVKEVDLEKAITDTDFRIDNIKAWKPTYLLFEYYSFYMVLDENGNWAEYLTDGNDEKINILPEWRKMFVKGLLVEELEIKGDSRAKTYEEDYNNLIEKIQRRNPNRAKRTGSFWW